MQILGRLENASNNTLLVDIAGVHYVYKPIAGERPLWDFPDATLAKREVAAFVLSELLGWNIVPQTTLEIGPEGEGSLQLWVDGSIDDVDLFSPTDVPHGWHHILSGVDESGQHIVLAHSANPLLAKLAVFDVIINNADRKAGHILTLPNGHIVGIDHGVAFHAETKLRTVLWGWINAPIETGLLNDLASLLPKIPGSGLAALLSEEEIAALIDRTKTVLERQVYPEPSADWPAVPWPVF
jgi:uncharacterized repeat protein (TIGR03843 family)